MEKPMVSVCMITYNHSQFIAEAIQGVLLQKTNFDVEVIIANDASSDTTDAILKLLLKDTATVKFRYFNHTENLGMYENFIFALDKCEGKYIALCEGDDYWIDSLKLQKQVDFLESNPEYEVCFTNVNIVNEEGKLTKERLISNNKTRTYEKRDLPIWAPTLTRVFKNRNFRNVIPKAPGLDTVMLLYQSQFGKIKFIDEITGTYRSHDKGAYSALSAIKRKEHNILTYFACISLVGNDFMPKYFGMLFKKLVELIPMDTTLFIKYRLRLFQEYKSHYSQFSFLTHFKIWLTFLMIYFPYFQKFGPIRKFTLKCVNRWFIY